MKWVAGGTVIALGLALLAGALSWPEHRVLAIVVAVLVLAGGAALLRGSLLMFAALWGVGWVTLVGGIASALWFAIAGAAVAVAGGFLAYATNNYSTWFGVAALGVAVALSALAFDAFGTHAALAGAATAAVALLCAAWAVSTVVLTYD
ncbi:hypothetical protein AB0M20_41855 [Actinoplanes sp. NPDC051633]|uniref:hypothetical protein n=1 Tax=Actinoplanes sp. NPDC051633 TaxID=3155670 RepID=UPI00343D2753